MKNKWGSPHSFRRYWRANISNALCFTPLIALLATYTVILDNVVYIKKLLTIPAYNMPLVLCFMFYILLITCRMEWVLSIVSKISQLNKADISDKYIILLSLHLLSTTKGHIILYIIIIHKCMITIENKHNNFNSVNCVSILLSVVLMAYFLL